MTIFLKALTGLDRIDRDVGFEWIEVGVCLANGVKECIFQMILISFIQFDGHILMDHTSLLRELQPNTRKNI